MTKETKVSKEETATVVRDKKILVVEDDFYFRTMLEKNLAIQLHKPSCADSAVTAQKMLEKDEFDLVLTDIRMPEMTGIELLKWIKGKFKVPVILMTGFSEIVEAHEAAQLGADGFLAKPFKTEELLAIISDCFPIIQKTDKIESLDQNFRKVSIEDFISGKRIKFDIYIRLGESKFVKIAHGGQDFPIEQLQTFKSKNIRHLFMQREDFRQYLGLNLTLTKIVTDSDKIEYEKKLNFVKHTAETLLQSFHSSEIDENDFEQAHDLVDSTVTLLGENPSALDLLKALSSHTDFLFAHSVGVSMYACLIGKAMGWTTTLTLSKLALGGILHDIGKKEIPRNILEKPRLQMTPEEISLIESHPVRGAEIMGQLEGTSTDLLQIIHEHHENCLGTGYPLKLKKPEINPLAKVIALASDFCNFAIKNPNSPGMLPREAVQRLLRLNPKAYDPIALQALLKIFKVKESE